MFFWAANYALGECIVVKMVTPTTIYWVWVWRLNGLDLRPCTARLKTWCRSVGNLGLRPKPISNKLELNADLLAFGCPKWNGLMCGRVRHGMALTSCLYVLTTGDRVSWFLVIAYPYDESKSCVWWIVLFVFYLFGLLYLRDSKTSESCRGDFPQCQSQHPARFIVLQRRQHALKGVARQGIDHGSACLCMCTAGTSSKATHM